MSMPREQAAMVFEHKLAMVRLLLKLDATEALRIMTREPGCAPELVYDSLQTPENAYMLDQASQVPCKK